MTNKAIGDFISDVTYQDKTTRALTGNTATGKLTIALGSTSNGTIGYADCYGSFNAAQNSYYAPKCYPQGTTPEQMPQMDAQGKITLTMTRQ